MENNSNQLLMDYMNQFAINTGLYNNGRAPVRYLWTDAFAVCNYLELYKKTRESKYLDLAEKLVHQVHHVLGKYRTDQSKKGWISGLDDKNAENHPTIGGLRIGKKFNERSKGDSIDEELEWEMDGQYYHYITKWIHSLNSIAKVSNHVNYFIWASELLKTAHKSFTYSPYPGTPMRMYWKMSIDLKRPLVRSMGQHDPLDGFVTYKETAVTATNFEAIKYEDLNINKEINEIKLICNGMDMRTTDPLGIGGLLSDATRVTQLMVNGSIKQTKFLENILMSTLVSLRSYLTNNPTEYPAEYRLAFRELGLSIGLNGLKIINKCFNEHPEIFTKDLNEILQRIINFSDIAQTIEEFWIESENQKSPSWRDHRDINTVMLGTSLAPKGFLRI
jgi:hypothetical protein